MISNQPDQGTSGQVTLNSNQAKQLVNKRRVRRVIKITNLSSIDVWIGYNNSVTQTTGDLLLGKKGAWIAIDTDDALWAIADSGNPVVSFLEVY